MGDAQTDPRRWGPRCERRSGGERGERERGEGERERMRERVRFSLAIDKKDIIQYT